MKHLAGITLTPPQPQHSAPARLRLRCGILVCNLHRSAVAHLHLLCVFMCCTACAAARRTKIRAAEQQSNRENRAQHQNCCRFSWRKRRQALSPKNPHNRFCTPAPSMAAVAAVAAVAAEASGVGRSGEERKGRSVEVLVEGETQWRGKVGRVRKYTDICTKRVYRCYTVTLGKRWRR